MKLTKKWLIVIVLLVGVLVWRVGQDEGEENWQQPDTPKRLEDKDEGYGFWVMADVHNDWTMLEKALDRAKEKQIELVLVAGDITNSGERKELTAAKKIMDESGVEIKVVPGNHDLWMSQRTGTDIFAEIFGDKYQTFKEKGIKFILMNNGNYRGIGEIQMEWLELEAEECGQIRCIAIMHMPLNHSFSKHVMGEDSQQAAEEAGKILELFRNKGVKDVITGHLHYSTSYELEGVRTWIVGGMSSERNNQSPRLTEFSLVDGELKREVIILE